MAASAALWIWMLGVALGLGFKDRSTWTAFDHLQDAVIPTLAGVLTMPGRMILDASDNAFVALGVMILNSLLWATALTAIFSGLKHFSASRQQRRAG